jgi:glycosyltransferase involved in cell wall biosynthesis
MFRPVMVDGQNASIFPSGDHRALATAMRRTLTDPALYNRLSNNALLTWEALKGPADWRTLIVKWAVEGSSSPWIRDHMLMAVRQQKHA